MRPDGGEGTTASGGAGQLRILVAALVGVFVTSFPAVILVASLPEIAVDLGTDQTTISWVITAPILISAVMLPLFGRLGDIHGHRRVLLVGLTLNALTSILCAAAWDVSSLIVLRSISQAAGGATHPTAIAILMVTQRGEARTRSLGYWAFVASGAPSLGLAFGGPLIGATSWRALFIVQTATAVIGLVMARRWLPETPLRSVPTLDLAGGSALMISIGALLLLLERGAVWGWVSVAAIVCALVGIAVGGVFVLVERSSPAPMLPLDLLARRSFALPILTEALSQASNMGVFYLIPFILHGAFEQNAAGTALLMLPLPVGMALASPVGGRLTWRIGSRGTAMLGAASLLIATAGIMAAERGVSLLLFIGSLILLGAGNGFLRPANASALTNAVDEHTMGVGTATLRMISQVGTTVGITIAVAAGGPEGNGDALWAALVVGALALVSALFLNRPTPTRRTAVPL